MINILLSNYDYGMGELQEGLSKYLRNSMKVAIIPFSHSETITTSAEYDRSINKGGEYYEVISDQFGEFGIIDDNISVVHYFYDEIEVMKDKISKADILFFTGGLPDKSVERLHEKDLVDTIKSFNGIIMGSSAGALIQLSEYFCTPDKDYSKFSFYKGLNLIKKDFYVNVHYRGNDLKSEFPELSNLKKTIYGIPEGAGIVISNNKIEEIGNVSKLDN